MYIGNPKIKTNEWLKLAIFCGRKNIKINEK